jgi:ribose transport system substrate-binding protein
MSRAARLGRTACGLGLLLALAGCGPAPDETRVVVIPKGLTHEFWQSIHRGARRAAADWSSIPGRKPVRIIWDGPLRERDALAQIRIIDRRVSTGADGIVLAPQHSETMVAPVRRAVERGVPVVIIDSGLKDPDLFVKYVATDNYRGGWLAAEHLLRVLEREGKAAPRIILLRYAIGSESTERREQGFEDYVAQQKRVKVTWLSKDKYAGATVDSSAKEARPLVQQFRDQCDAIFAPNESSATGVLNVLESLDLAREAGRARGIHLMGFDSSERLLAAVQRGQVDGVVVQDPYRMGYTGVWAVLDHRLGVDLNPPGSSKSYSTGEYLIVRRAADWPGIPNLYEVGSAEARGLYNPVAQEQRAIKPPAWGAPPGPN